MSIQKIKNNLINETSPYLLQHATNPVNWYPWSQEALEKARLEDKPILLSIGYSACHWCHVMAHESFEDDSTAKIMNEHFINIKVDREERPDIDKIYQIAQQLLTQRNGGWPLTMFLTPEDQLPFFGGTYFPPESRYGLPGFRDLLIKIADFYRQQRDSITAQNRTMQDALEKTSTAVVNEAFDVKPDNTPLQTAVSQLQAHFDQTNGGFSMAPKFPHPTSLELLMRNLVGPAINPEEKSQLAGMIDLTLRKMATGGIYDQIGGGFCRYSVDATWTIPHFEKMLYDNGPLLDIYTKYWQITGDDYFKTIALETADWIIRDMQGPEGGYYSTLDADSEGVEGKFYVWDREEIRSLLNEQDYRICESYYGLNNPANFEGKWHLRIDTPLTSVAQTMDISPREVEQGLARIKQQLLQARNKRVWPGRDEKILTSWNALMIKGMAGAARVFNRKDYFDSANNALDFIYHILWNEDRLLATYKDNKAHLNAYLDDYAFLIDAILALLQYEWRNDRLKFAICLADSLLENFEDGTQGGFFFTSHDHEKLIQRQKPLMDDALPAGNGIAALSLGRLGHLLGDERYLAACDRVLKYSWTSLHQYPSACNALLFALDEYLQPPATIILRGNKALLPEWQQLCLDEAGIFTQVFSIPDEVSDLPGLLAKRDIKSEVTAYICQGFSCKEPLTRLDLLKENLNNLSK